MCDIAYCLLSCCAYVAFCKLKQGCGSILINAIWALGLDEVSTRVRLGRLKDGLTFW